MKNQNQKKHENKLIQLMNQLNKDLFSCKEDRNTNAAKDTLNAINLLVKEQIKIINN